MANDNDRVIEVLALGLLRAGDPRLPIRVTISSTQHPDGVSIVSDDPRQEDLKGRAWYWVDAAIWEKMVHAMKAAAIEAPQTEGKTDDR